MVIAVLDVLLLLWLLPPWCWRHMIQVRCGRLAGVVQKRFHRTGSGIVRIMSV